MCVAINGLYQADTYLFVRAQDAPTPGLPKPAQARDPVAVPSTCCLRTSFELAFAQPDPPDRLAAALQGPILLTIACTAVYSVQRSAHRRNVTRCDPEAAGGEESRP